MKSHLVSNDGKTIRVRDTPWDWIKNLINRLANDHEPVEDLDGDDFSSKLIKEKNRKIEEIIIIQINSDGDVTRMVMERKRLQ